MGSEREKIVFLQENYSQETWHAMSLHHDIILFFERYSMIPMIIETDRLILRAPQPDEAVEVYQAVRESAQEMKPWIDWVEDWSSPARVEEIAYRCRVWFYNRETFTWRIYRRDTQQFVGTVELHSIDWEVPRAEIGYWIRSSAAGQGFITEAVGEVVQLALESWGIKRIQALCDARNTRAIHIAEKLGFQQEGTLHAYERDASGALCDIVVLGKVIAL